MRMALPAVVQTGEEICEGGLAVSEGFDVSRAVWGERGVDGCFGKGSES